MTITKQRENSALTLTLEGRLDTSTAPQMEAELNGGLDGINDLTIDMKELV